MAYRLSLADDVPSAVRACAREQLEQAAQRLANADADPVDAVHEARKSLKKTRALLRLARPALGRRAYREENAALRELAAALSGTRDADVLAHATAYLAEHAAGRLPAVDFEQLQAALEQEASAARATNGGDRAGGVIDGLRAAAERVDAWPLDGATWDDLLAGATRAYARGRDTLAQARSDPTDEHLHEWRKRVKDLWYHERLLEPAWPEVLNAHGEQAHVLSELLGDDHDLSLLRARLQDGLPLGPAAGADISELLNLLDDRRTDLRTRAWPLGDRLYAESPKAFTRRLTRYIKSAVHQQHVAEAEA